MNEMKVFLKSIKDSLLIIAMMSLCTFILVILFIGFRIYEDYIEYINDSKTKVTVALQDISAGTMINKGMVALKKIENSKLPDIYVCPHSTRILYGHKTTVDFKKGEPLDFTKTDIYIPYTYNFNMKNPDESDTSNPSSPDR